MKKLLLTLSLVLALLLVPFSVISASADTLNTTGDCVWSLDGTTLTISGNGNMADYSATDPAPWGTEVTEVIIEEGVTCVGDYAFSNNRKLASVTVPKTVIRMGNFAFNSCYNGKDVYITDMTAWCHIDFENKSANPLYFSEYGLYNNLYLNGVLVTEPEIPTDITTLGGAFRGCDSIVKVTIPNGVTAIENSEFSGCEALKQVTIPNTVKKIGSSAFYDCPKLQSMTIPDSVESIGTMAFLYCYDLTDLVIGKGVTVIESETFVFSGIKNITIPNSITEIKDAAFYQCNNIENVYYGGTPEDKENLIIDIENEPLLLPEWHFTYCVHDWKNADCLTAKKCNLCGKSEGVALGHSYSADCDPTCNRCDETRKANHIYDNICDDYCNICNEQRTDNHSYKWVTDVQGNCGVDTVRHQECTICGVTASLNTIIPATGDHRYNNTCDTNCNVCNYLREVPPHLYDNDCDAICNICNKVRTITHNYEWVIDKEATCGASGLKHQECTVCAKQKNKNTSISATGNHTYDNTCDTVCNVCNKVRTVSHKYVWVIDIPNNCGVSGLRHQECSVCGIKRNENTVIPATNKHTYDNACDTACNECGFIRTVSAHVYTNSCDTDCNICGNIREITHNYKWIIEKTENCGVNGIKHEECTVCGVKQNENTVIPATNKHTYDNACDTNCNVCNLERTVSPHIYSNACDNDCNICGNIREIAHNYEWIIDKTENCGMNGIKHEECTVCGFKRNENTVIPATNKHTYDNACDESCNICDCTRTVPDHVYDAPWDEDCNICGEIRGINHQYKWVIDKAETCGENGIKHEECIVCGIKKNENTIIPATNNHIYDNACDDACNVCDTIRKITHNYIWIVDKKATCGTDGFKHRECTVCNNKADQNTAILATGKHIYDNNCDTTCDVCGENRTIIHDYASATCTTPQICKVCGVIKGSALGHKFDNDCDTNCNVCHEVREITHNYKWIIDKTENCGVNGVKHEECTVCGIKRNENTVIPATNKHTYDNACDESCNICDCTRTVPDHVYDAPWDEDCNICGEIRGINHQYKWVIDKAETCGENGIKHEECAVCGLKKNLNTVIYATGNHNYDNACDAICNVCEQIRIVPDHIYDNPCDNDCNICSEKRNITHDYKWIIDKNENCGVNGSKHEECIICGVKRNENTVINATGKHTYNNACDTTCNVCDEIREITHNYIWLVDKKATCGANGFKHKECTICNDKIEENTVIKATGKHTYTNACDTTCDICNSPRQVGEHIYDNACDTTCNICGSKRAITHDYKWVIDKVETCGVDGIKHQECTVCGAKINLNTIIDATGNHIFDNDCDKNCNDCAFGRETADHIYDNSCDTDCNICGVLREVSHDYIWLIDKKATCGTDGFKHKECTVCNAKTNENTVILANGKHSYDNTCDKECNVCGNTRNITHNYTLANCTTPQKCKICGATYGEALGHKFDNACDESCNMCDFIRQVPDHVYDAPWDEDCNVCGEIRGVTHSYKWVIDKNATCGENGIKHEECSVCGVKKNLNTVIPATNNHKFDNACDNKCNVCGQIRTVSDHIYDNPCDNDCNICGEKRNITHDYKWIIDKNENCGVNGSKHQECTICGDETDRNTIIPATNNHKYDNACDKNCNVCGFIRQVAEHIYDNNCDTDCNICGVTRKITHNYEWVIDKAENCGADGSKHQECTVCGVKQNENTIISATGKHNYDNVCDATCNVCDFVREVLGHIYTNSCDTKCNLCGTLREITHNYIWLVDKKATCGENGAKHHECTVCGAKTDIDTVILATGKHSYDNACDSECNVCGLIRQVPDHIYDNTCDTDCNICGATREVIHNLKWVIDKNENCGINGLKHQECTVCGAVFNQNTVINATGKHSYDNACDTTCNVCAQIRTVPPHVYDNACDTTCNICNAVRSITHNYKWIVAVPENCGVNGSKYECCVVCGAKRNENTVINATGKHTYDNSCDTNCNLCGNVRNVEHNYIWLVDKKANCGENGSKHQECTVCNHIKNQNTVILATGNHIYDNACDKECNLCGNMRYVAHTLINATCTEPQKCKTCGETFGDALGHKFDNACDESCNMCDFIRQVPDHVYDAPWDEDCNICGEIRGITHSYKWVIDKNATCGENGIKHEECSVCGVKKNIDTVIPATNNHTFDNACDGECNLCKATRPIIHDYTAATCTTPEICKICGETHGIALGHKYDNVCDTNCNICGDVRAVNHNYNWVIDKHETCGENGVKHEECTVCGIKKNENTVIPATAMHIYDNDCDADCNLCGGDREIIHNFEDATCIKPKTCKVCGATEGEALGHTYDNDCDTDCNLCGNVREITHNFEDATCLKPKTCKVCGATDGEALGHTYDNDCDTDCNLCGNVREIIHNFEDATCIKPKTCKVCGATDGEALGHIYDNDCDAYCNICDFIREVAEHQYTNPADKICDICGAERVVEGEQLIEENGIFYYYLNGEKTDVTTLVKIDGVWLYIENGIKSDATTLVDYNSKTFYVIDGVWNSKIADTLYKINGKWHYIKNGKFDSTATTLVKYSGKWFYVKNGLKTTSTTLVKYKSKWFYVEKGKINWTAKTLVKYNGKLYYVNNGKVDWNMKTIVKYNGKKYYVNGGSAQTKFSGKVKIKDKTYTVKKGIVK